MITVEAVNVLNTIQLYGYAEDSTYELRLRYANGRRHVKRVLHTGSCYLIEFDKNEGTCIY